MAYEENTVEEWFECIASGLEYRRKFGLENDWFDNECMFYNTFKNLSDMGGPNIMISQGDAMLSSLNVPYPYVSVTPERFDGIIGAEILTKLDNKLLKNMKMRREVTQATLHGFLYGKMILKLGYDSEFGYDPLEDIMQGQAGMTLSQHDKKGRAIEFNSRIKPGTPWVKAVLPHDIVVPWGTVWMDDAEWVAHRIVRHIDDIKSDPKYENKKDLRPVMSREDFTRTYSSVMKPYRMGKSIAAYNSFAQNSEEDEAEYCELWEIHEKRTGHVKVLATGHDQFLRDERDDLQIVGLPFAAVNFIPNSRTFWVTPDASYLRQPQFELTDITAQATKQRRLSTLKFLYEEGAIEEDELAKFLSARVGVACKVKQGKQIDQVIKFMQASQNPQIYNEAQQTRRNAQEISGMSRNQSGEYDSSSRRTATEAGIVDQGSKMRSSRRGSCIEDIYSDSFEIINSYIFEFWKTPRITDVLGPDGVQQFITYVGENLRGDYSYTTSISENPPPGPQARKQEALQEFQFLAQDPAIDPAALRQFLSSAVNDPRFSALYKPGLVRGGQPNAQVPVQMQQQQMQQGNGANPQNPGSGGDSNMPMLR